MRRDAQQVCRPDVLANRLELQPPRRAAQGEEDDNQYHQRQRDGNGANAQRVQRRQIRVRRERLGAAGRGPARLLPGTEDQEVREPDGHEVQAHAAKDLVNVSESLERACEHPPERAAYCGPDKDEGQQQRRRQRGEGLHDPCRPDRAEHHLPLDADIPKPRGKGDQQPDSAERQRHPRGDDVGRARAVSERAVEHTLDDGQRRRADEHQDQHAYERRQQERQHS